MNLRARFFPTVWQRRTIIVWNAGNDAMTTTESLVRLCRTYGFKCVCVKVCDGAGQYRGAAGHNLEPSFYAPLRKAGIIVTGWGYAYGNNPDGEALIAAATVRELGLAAYVVDAEREFDAREYGIPGTAAYSAGYGRSARWVEAWQDAQGSAKPIAAGLTSFGRTSLHDIDWHAWAVGGFRWLPQAYYNESNMLAVPICVADGARFFDRRRIHPMLGTYGGALGRIDPAVYAAQLRQARTIGFSLYSGDEARELDYAGLARST